MLYIVAMVTGERALRQILEDALKIAERCAHPADRDAIVKAVSDIQSMADALAELRAQGKVSVHLIIMAQVYFLLGSFLLDLRS